MSLLSIVNICFLIMLTNFNLGLNVFGLELLQGTYNSFDTNWYQVVGSSICVTLALFILTVNIGNYAFHCMAGCIRCCDRSCRCDRRYTKTLTQHDYENKNTFWEFDMKHRYTTMLTVVFLVMIYSSGIPVLYPLASLYLTTVYWADKH